MQRRAMGVAKFVRYIEVVFHRFNYFWGGELNIVRYNEDYATQTFAILMPLFIYPVFFYTTSFLSLD